MKRITAVLLIITLLFSLLLLTSCGGSGIKENTYEHEIQVLCGDTIHLELDHIPEGITAEDYQWDLPVNLLEGSGGEFVAVGCGHTSVKASAKWLKEKYTELFDIYIYPKDGIRFTEDQIPVLLESGATKLVQLEFAYNDEDDGVSANWDPWDGAVSFTEEPDVSDVLQIETEGRTGGGQMATADRRFALTFRWTQPSAEPFTFTLKADCGAVSADTQVTVYNANDPIQIMKYLVCSESAPAVQGKTVTLGELDSSNDVSITKEEYAPVGSAPKGKYAAVYCSDETEYYYFHSGVMAKLPDNLRPDSLSEVEYLIQARPGEQRHIKDYITAGGRIVPAYQLTTDIVLVNAATGEDVEKLQTLYGDTDFTIKTGNKEYIAEDSEEIFGNAPTRGDINSALFDEIKKLWEAQGYTVK